MRNAKAKVKGHGVSNFLRDDLENLLSDCRVKPMVNQILLHISNTDLALLDYCREQGIQVEAYSPHRPWRGAQEPRHRGDGERVWRHRRAAVHPLCHRARRGRAAEDGQPDHMASNAAVDFTISSEDRETLKHTDRIADYGEFNIFPVFSGKPLA